MEEKIEDLSFEELIALFNAMQEFIEYLGVEENAEIEVRKKK